MHCVLAHFSESAHIEEGCVSIAVRRFDNNVVDRRASPMRELTATSLDRPKDSRQLQGLSVPFLAERAGFPIIRVDLFGLV
jgi:hypothetical protein